MKLSIDIPNPLNQSAEVFLNEVLQKNVIEADEENGYVIKYADPKVRFSADYLIHKLFGKVVITFGSK